MATKSQTKSQTDGKESTSAKTAGSIVPPKTTFEPESQGGSKG